MAITEDKLNFQLKIMCRHDEKSGAFVGYIPRLQVYSQAYSPEDLYRALTVTAREFIIACANKGILRSVLKEGGLHATPPAVSERVMNDRDGEFVAIEGYQECEQPIEVTLPFSVLAEHEAATVS
jgi:hypothetical protein